MVEDSDLAVGVGPWFQEENSFEWHSDSEHSLSHESQSRDESEDEFVHADENSEGGSTSNNPTGIKLFFKIVPVKKRVIKSARSYFFMFLTYFVLNLSFWFI